MTQAGASALRWGGSCVALLGLSALAFVTYPAAYVVGLGLTVLGPLYALVAAWLRWHRRHHYEVAVTGDGQHNAASEFATLTQVALLATRWALALCLASFALSVMLNSLPGLQIGNAPVWLLALAFCSAFAIVPIPYLGVAGVLLGLFNALGNAQQLGETHALTAHEGAVRLISTSRRLGALVTVAYTLATLLAVVAALSGHGLPIPVP